VDVFNNRLVLFAVFRPTMFFHDVHGGRLFTVVVVAMLASSHTMVVVGNR